MSETAEDTWRREMGKEMRTPWEMWESASTAAEVKMLTKRYEDMWANELIAEQRAREASANLRVYYVPADTWLPEMDNKEMGEAPVTLTYMGYQVFISSARGSRP